jgi:hypothetical protein
MNQAMTKVEQIKNVYFRKKWIIIL